MTRQSPAVRKVDHFHHRDQPVVATHFGTEITTPNELLTLIIRKDAQFATRDLQSAFALGSIECLSHRNSPLSPQQFTHYIETAYAAWGNEIVAALATHLDYEGKYSLEQPSCHGTHVHFHAADSLAGSVIRKACDLVKQTRGDKDALFISFDDMIHEDVFRASASRGQFSEISFSRLFSPAGEELGFVGRPGRSTIEAQIKNVKKTLATMRGDSEKRVPIILLEDNVRRAKTLLWIFAEMEKHGAFKDGELAGIATCFSVATPHEQAQIRFEDREIPLVVGADYTRSPAVDVVTPRDHLFDGFVVSHSNGKFGRLPSFMLSDAQKAADMFKIHKDSATAFRSRVIDANLNFCSTVENTTGVTPLLDWFVSGPAITAIAGHAPTTPMARVLEEARKKRTPHLRPVN